MNENPPGCTQPSASTPSTAARPDLKPLIVASDQHPKWLRRKTAPATPRNDDSSPPSFSPPLIGFGLGPRPRTSVSAAALGLGFGPRLRLRLRTSASASASDLGLGRGSGPARSRSRSQP